MRKLKEREGDWKSACVSERDNTCNGWGWGSVRKRERERERERERW